MAIAKGNNEDQNARLFALVNTATADTGTLAWDQKYICDLWRPMLGIREHNPSFGPVAPEAVLAAVGLTEVQHPEQDVLRGSSVGSADETREGGIGERCLGSGG